MWDKALQNTYTHPSLSCLDTSHDNVFTEHAVFSLCVCLTVCVCVFACVCVVEFTSHSGPTRSVCWDIGLFAVVSAVSEHMPHKVPGKKLTFVTAKYTAESFDFR